MQDVEFEDLSYSTTTKKICCLHKEKQNVILKGVSGYFKNGQLSAIMGPSGAGKSTLLNAVSGMKPSSGTVQINRKKSCYITQEDLHQSYLTVYELMQFSCRLKLNLPSTCMYDALIDEVLQNLHLSHRKNSTAEFLSGGEKKRLSVALELITNPSNFFLDEPTSGLDEVNAVQMIRQLKKLALQGHTVVCTIHQPSAIILEMFDHLYILAKGKCVYQGSPKALVPYLDSVNIECPESYNPADFMIELCESEDAQQNIQNFSESFQNGKISCNFTQLNLVSKNPIEKMVQSTTEGGKRISSFHQFGILLEMMILKTIRNRIALCLQLATFIICGTFIGLLYFQAANDGSRMFDHLKLCWACTICTAYAQFMIPVLTYPYEVKLVKKEHFNRWYKIEPYYWALTVSRIPIQIGLTVVFSLIIYFLTGLPHQWWRFAGFNIVCFFITFGAEGIGLLIGVNFNVTNGSVVGPMFGLTLIVFGIYGIEFMNKLSMTLKFVLGLSIVRRGCLAMLLVLFGFDRNKLDCPEIYCHFDDPKTLLKLLQLENSTFWEQILYFIGIIVVFRIFVFISLKRRFSKKRKSNL